MGAMMIHQREERGTVTAAERTHLRRRWLGREAEFVTSVHAKQFNSSRASLVQYSADLGDRLVVRLFPRDRGHLTGHGSVFYHPRETLHTPGKPMHCVTTF
jgi:hypothetical protein